MLSLLSNPVALLFKYICHLHVLLYRARPVSQPQTRTNTVHPSKLEALGVIFTPASRNAVLMIVLLYTLRELIDHVAFCGETQSWSVNRWTIRLTSKFAGLVTLSLHVPGHPAAPYLD